MHKRNLFTLVLATLTCCAGCASTETFSNSTELPVSRVVMYQSGIGYVERNATVNTDELVLRIRPDQINDILKSLTVIDRGNGRPVSISLPVDRNTLDRLSEIPVQVREGGIKSLLEAFRGAHVKIKTRGASYEGRIVGLEEPAQHSEVNINTIDTQENRTTVTLLSDANKLNVIQVSEIKSVELYDKSLSNGLDKSLNISLNEGDWKQIELKIRMDSSKKRDLALSYLVAMPTWKPAYRLIIEDNNNGVLQGWAIISNVTGADWNDISFSLVSGQPMSFTYDLYTPQFLERPDLSSLAGTRASAPKVMASAQSAAPRTAPTAEKSKVMYAGGAINSMMAPKSASKSSASRLYDMEDMAAADEGGFEMTMEEAEEDYAPIADDEMVSNFTELASKAQIGSFDEYKLASKLTVPDGSTALVNLIQHKLTARDTRLFDKPSFYSFEDFNKGWRLTKSYQTIELKNEADVALDAGPITIYRDSAVIGEGYLSRTEKDATAYITFANEGRLNVSVSDTSQISDYVLESMNNGRCQVSEEIQRTNKFDFESRIQNSATALLQMPIFTSWTPVDFPESVVKNDNAYVFSVEVPANSTITVPITMKSTRKTRGQMNSNACKIALNNAIKNGQIPAEKLDQFNLYAQKLETRDKNQEKINELVSRQKTIQNDQNSLTQTIAGLKDIKTSKADSLKNQLIDRQKSNEKDPAAITTEIYTLEVENSELNLELKTLERELVYQK